MISKVNKKSLSIKDCVSVSVRSRSNFRIRLNGQEVWMLPNDLITVRPISDAPFSFEIELLGVESLDRF